MKFRFLYSLFATTILISCVQTENRQSISSERQSDQIENSTRCKFLSQQVATHLRNLTDLSFEVVVTEEGIRPDGTVVEPREAAHAFVSMSGDKIHLEVFKNNKLVVIVNRDGKNVTEWNEIEHKAIQYPIPKPEDPEYGNLVLGEGIEGCAIGTLLRSWLEKSEDSHINFYESKIAEGKPIGPVEVDGRTCECVVWEKESRPPNEPEYLVVRHRLFIDPDDFFVYRRDTEQTGFDSSDGKVLYRTFRSKIFRNVNTQKIPEVTFDAQKILERAGTERGRIKDLTPSQHILKGVLP